MAPESFGLSAAARGPVRRLRRGRNRALHSSLITAVAASDRTTASGTVEGPGQVLKLPPRLGGDQPGCHRPMAEKALDDGRESQGTVEGPETVDGSHTSEAISFCLTPGAGRLGRDYPSDSASNVGNAFASSNRVPASGTAEGPGHVPKLPPRLGLDQPGCRRPPAEEAEKAEKADEAAEYHAYIESHLSTISEDTPEADRMAVINEAVRYFKERWPDGPPT